MSGNLLNLNYNYRWAALQLSLREFMTSQVHTLVQLSVVMPKVVLFSNLFSLLTNLTKTTNFGKCAKKVTNSHNRVRALM